MLREGAHASYVGYEGDGRSIGDRCLVLSLERKLCHVRWVTGGKVGAYECLPNDDLVADRMPARFADEFTFDTFSGRIVNVACRDVRNAKGDKALLRAIDQEGHLSDLRMFASRVVGELHHAMHNDPSWLEIEADLGDDALAFQSYILRELIAEAMREAENDGAVPAIQDGE